jgi:hypothetical protein
MGLIFYILRRVLTISVLLAAGVIAYDYYKIKSVGLPCKMTLWDEDFRSIKVELLSVNDSHIRFKRLADGQHLSIHPQKLSFLTRSRVQWLKKQQTADQPSELNSAQARLLERRQELLDRIEYLNASTEVTTSAVEAHTLTNKIQEMREDLLKIEKRLKDSGAEIDYTASSDSKGSKLIQNISSQLIKQVSGSK